MENSFLFCCKYLKKKKLFLAVTLLWVHGIQSPRQVLGFQVELADKISGDVIVIFVNALVISCNVNVAQPHIILPTE